MKQESSEGCPRCDDYNEVVEELKKEKENKDREVKSQLQKCEERHKGHGKENSYHDHNCSGSRNSTRQRFYRRDC